MQTRAMIELDGIARMSTKRTGFEIEPLISSRVLAQHYSPRAVHGARFADSIAASAFRRALHLPHSVKRVASAFREAARRACSMSALTPVAAC